MQRLSRGRKSPSFKGERDIIVVCFATDQVSVKGASYLGISAHNRRSSRPRADICRLRPFSLNGSPLVATQTQAQRADARFVGIGFVQNPRSRRGWCRRQEGSHGPRRQPDESFCALASAR